MGGCLDYRTYLTDDKTKVRQAFQGDCQQSRYEDGHSYSGAIGMMHGIQDWIDISFQGPQAKSAAIAYIDDNHRKWDDAMAVSFVNDKGLKGWVVGGICSS